MKWRKAAGFESRRVAEWTEHCGFRLTVTNKIRLAGSWQRSRLWMAYIDNDYVGCANTLEGAKMAAELIAATYG